MRQNYVDTNHTRYSRFAGIRLRPATFGESRMFPTAVGKRVGSARR